MSSLRVLLFVVVLGLGTINSIGSSAYAQDYPLFSDPKVHVRTWPPSFVPEAIGRVGLNRLEQALQDLDYPFYVVFYETLPSGAGDEDQRAQALTDGAAAAWGPQGYDLAQASVFALTFSPRTFSLLAGSRWKAELGLHAEALDPFIDRFLARVRGTPSDPVSGIIDMARSMNDTIFEQVDPVRVAERLKREQAAARVQAKNALNAQIDAAREALDHHYTPADKGAWIASLARAQAALAGDDPSALMQAAATLETEFAPLQTIISDEIDATARRSMFEGFIIIMSLLFLLFAVIFFLVRRGQLSRRREAYGALTDAWKAKTTNAAGRYVEFYGKRDGVLGLLELEGKTKALLDQVTTEVDAIYASVAAMDAHLAATDDKASSARWYRLKPIDEALIAIESTFTFDTGALNEADLFGPQTKQIAIEPAKLEAELEARFSASVAGWKRLEMAAELRFSDASTLLPQALLDEVLTKAEGYALPARWFADHPLFGDAEADRAVWEAADAWRWKDAIAFLDAIDELRAKHEASVALLGRLVAVRDAVARVHVAELREVAPRGTTLFAASDDPADTLEDARTSGAELDQCIIEASDIARVEAVAKRTIELYEKCEAQTIAIEVALRRCGPEIEASERLREAAIEYQQIALGQAELAAQWHSNSRARGLLDVCKRRFELGTTELATAKHKLATRFHLDAHRAALGAKETFGAARDEAEQCSAHVAQLEATRLAYEQRIEDLERVMGDKLSDLRRYGASSLNINAFNPPTIHGPADYGALTTTLDGVVEGWNAAVRSARQAWEEAERRRREAAAAAARAAASAAAAARARTTSWSSSSSSRSSFSSSSRSSSSSSSSRSGSWSSGSSSSRSGKW